jgi:release factor glutamine methyltransferase
MNIKSAVFLSYNQLNNNKIKSPHLEAEILLSHVLNKPREYILAYPEYELNKQQKQKFRSLIKKRLAGYPLAYLIGAKAFYGLNFFVNKNVLIPRPETELMIDQVREIAKNTKQKYTFVDVGTGSGCIIITLAKLLNPSTFYGIDISEKALNIAKKNAKINNIKNVKFIQGNLLKPFVNTKFVIRNTKFVILANLPYLTPKQTINSPSIQHEPKLALVAGQDGLKYYRQLLQQITKNNLNFNYLLLEIDPLQKISISRLLKSALPEASWQIKKDLKGHSRLVVIKKNANFPK